MPDISAERLQNMIDCPESSEVAEVRDVARLLVECQDVLLIRNHQNRTLASLTQEAGMLFASAQRKYALLKQGVINTAAGIALFSIVAIFWFF